MDNRLVALCVGNAIIGTGTMLVPGMLPVLTAGLHVDLPAGGRLIAAFGLTVCVLTPVLAGWLSRIDRRVLLSVLLLLFCAGHAVAALADSYGVVLATRVACAISAGLFTSQAAGVTRLLVPPERQGAAVGFVFLGWSIAAVAGMPLGAWIGTTFGWRAGFATVALLAFAAMVWVWLVLPGGLRVDRIDGRAWKALARNVPVLAVVAVTALHSSAQFVVFSYYTPILVERTGAGPGGVPAMLGLFGLAGILGNVVSIRTLDRFGVGTVATATIALMAAGQVLMLAGGYGWPGMIAGSILWGLGCFAANSAQQARLLGLAPALAPVSIALNSSAIYFGQAVGAEGGGRIISAAGFDPLPWASLPVFLVALALSVAVERARRRG